MSMRTSRVARKPIAVPSGVDVVIKDQELTVKGPKGKVEINVQSFIKLVIEGNEINVGINTGDGYCRSGSGSKLRNSTPGMMRAKISNMITGVTKGFEKKLLLVGVGYRAQIKGKTLSLTVGFSHPVLFDAPEGIVIETPTQTEVIVKGIDKHLVGHVAATIRDIRPPELYKGKGIRYSDEVIICKETKKK